MKQNCHWRSEQSVVNPQLVQIILHLTGMVVALHRMQNWGSSDIVYSPYKSQINYWDGRGEL